MSKPRFTHDCAGCCFMGQGVLMGQEVDWYTCLAEKAQYHDGCRTLVARYGNDGPQYASSTIGDTIEPGVVVMAALAQGLELLEPEKDKLLEALLSQHRQGKGAAFYADCMPKDSDDHNQIGHCNWLRIEP